MNACLDTILVILFWFLFGFIASFAIRVIRDLWSNS